MKSLRRHTFHRGPGIHSPGTLYKWDVQIVYEYVWDHPVDGAHKMYQEACLCRGPDTPNPDTTVLHHWDVYHKWMWHSGYLRCLTLTVSKEACLCRGSGIHSPGSNHTRTGCPHTRLQYFCDASTVEASCTKHAQKKKR